MRVIRTLVPDDRCDDLIEYLHDEGIDHVVTREASDDDRNAVLLEFPLPTSAVETVMDDLREAGFDEKYTIVSSAESVTTPQITDLEQRYAGDELGSVHRGEIRAKARELTPNRLTYYSLTLISALVAVAGLLLDSPAIVVGAMVIAPQVSAAMTASIGTVLDDRRMVVQGFTSLAGGLVVAVAGAAAFGWFVRTTGFIPATLDVHTIAQISRRISPGALSIVVGAGAGAAAAFGLATAFPMSLVGVMIAAALIPAAATVGIGIAWGLPSVALGALLLLIVNTVLIVLGALGVLWYLGYRPDDWIEQSGWEWVAGSFPRPTVVVLAVLAVVLLASSGFVADELMFENEVNDEVEAVLAKDEYEEVRLVAVQTEFTDAGLAGDDRRVSIVLHRPADRPYPDLPEAIADSIADRTGTNVVLEIEYVETSRHSRTAGS